MVQRVPKGARNQERNNPKRQILRVRQARPASLQARTICDPLQEPQIHPRARASKWPKCTGWSPSSNQTGWSNISTSTPKSENKPRMISRRISSKLMNNAVHSARPWRMSRTEWNWNWRPKARKPSSGSVNYMSKILLLRRASHDRNV